MEKQGKRMGNIKVLLIAMLAAYLITSLGLFLLALLLLRFGLSKDAVEIGILFLYSLSCFLAGFLAGKLLKIKKFFFGMCVGGSYYLLLCMVSLVLNRSIEESLVSMITVFLLCLGSGMLGGMVA